MYTIKLIDTIIHDERTVFVEQPVLTRKLNKAGTLTFTITKDNPGYELILPRYAQVYVYRGGISDEDVLWSGIVLTYKYSLYGEKEVTCEGTLALLNDTSFTVQEFGITKYSLSDYLYYFYKSLNDSVHGSSGYENVGICFPKQEYAGRMHICILTGPGAETSRELFSTSGVTAEELSYQTIYAPSANPGIYVAYEPGESGEDAQSIRFGNTFITTHAVSNSYPVQNITVDTSKYYTIVPNQALTIDTQAPTYCMINASATGYRVIKNIYKDTPNFGNDVVIADGAKDSYCSGMEKIEKIIKRYGGYFKATAIDYSGMILRYWDSFSKSCGQKITLGDNLEDYIEDLDFDNIYTVLTPFGKNKGTSLLWDYVTIESVNGKCGSITNDELAKKYGTIQKVVHYNDIDDPNQLLRMTKNELKKAMDFELSVSVKAVDKSMTDVDKQAFDIGLLTEITIPPLNIIRNLICTSIVNHLSEPEKDEYTFGAAPKTSSSYAASGTPDGRTGAEIEVVEANGGYCLKFPNGWAIAVKWQSVSFTTPTAWGNLWYGNCGAALGALPITFKNIIYRNLTVDDGGAYWLLWNPGSVSNWSGTIYPIGATKQTATQKLIFRGICIGTWK